MARRTKNTRPLPAKPPTKAPEMSPRALGNKALVCIIDKWKATPPIPACKMTCKSTRQLELRPICGSFDHDLLRAKPWRSLAQEFVKRIIVKVLQQSSSSVAYLARHLSKCMTMKVTPPRKSTGAAVILFKFLVKTIYLKIPISNDPLKAARPHARPEGLG